VAGKTTGAMAEISTERAALRDYQKLLVKECSV